MRTVLLSVVAFLSLSSMALAAPPSAADPMRNKASGLTPDEAKTLVKNFVEVVKNQRKLDRLGEFFAPDYVEHNQTVASFGAGIKGYQAFLGHLFAAYPDDVLTVDEIVSDGERVSYRGTETGTHKGTFLGIPATQKKPTWTEIQFFRIKDGKVVEHWVNVDLFSWFTQIGVIPPMKK